MKMPTWLTGLFSRRGSLANPPAWLTESFGATPSASGVVVTDQSALSCGAVYAAVRVLADSIAQLPVKVQRVTAGNREDDRSHPLWSLLHALPNPEMTAFEFKHVMQQALVLHGNAYAEIERNQLGQPVALWPLVPTAMAVYRDPKTRNKVWDYTLPNGQHAFFEWTNPTRKPSPILHIRGLGDALVGYSTIKILRETIGKAIATAEYGARLFSNSAQPRGYLKVPPTMQALTPEQKVKLKEQWESAHRGLANAHRVAILEHGLEWEQIGMNAEDAQFIESQKLNERDIAQAFRVPPHMIGVLDNATFSNIEHQGIDFVVHSLGPWIECWEEAIARDLLSLKGFETHQIKFVVAALLRGDTASRYAAYAVGRQWGWLSANDIRALEDMNGIGPQGDVYLTPANMFDASTPPAERPDLNTPAPANPAALRRAS